LHELPPGIVAQYPLVKGEQASHTDNWDDSPPFVQGLHDKPILNGYAANSLQERRALQVAEPLAPDVAGHLAMLGVGWLLMDRAAFEQQASGLRASGSGYRFVADDDQFALYEVVAAPKPLVTLGDGFGDLEETPETTFRWLRGPEGTVELLGPCERCRGSVSFDAVSFVIPRRAELLDEDGQVVASATIPADRSKRVSFPVEFGQRAHFELRTTPGPIAAPEVTGGEERALSVSLTNGRLTLR
jgi:hypothetical protein